MDTCTMQPDCDCFDCFTNLDQETPVTRDHCNNPECIAYLPTATILCMSCIIKRNNIKCITTACNNPVDVPGSKCPTCNLWYRAYIASGASDYLTWEQYVELMQEEAQEEADFHCTCADAEARWLIG